MSEPIDWKPIAGAVQDGRMYKLYCPGVSQNTNGVLLGGWLARLSIWQLLPYGTTQPVTLYPSMFAELDPAPTEVTDKNVQTG